MSASPIVFWLLLIAAFLAGRWLVRILTAGWTVVQTNRSLHRRSQALARTHSRAVAWNGKEQ